jgi:hypothetical protein
MKMVTTVSCRSGGKILSYFFPFRSLFNSRGLRDVKGLPPLSAARKGDGCIKKQITLHVTFAVTLTIVQVPKREKVAQYRTVKLAAQWNRVGLERPHFGHVSVPKVNRGSLQPNQKLLSVRAARI